MNATASFGLAFIAVTAAAASAADAPAPGGFQALKAGNEVILQMKGRDGTSHDVVFRYCPLGEVVLGDASVDSALVKPMKPFLMMETELGIGLAHALAPSEIWERITTRVAPLNDPDVKSNLAAPAAAGAVPLTYVGLDDAARICDVTSRAGISTAAVSLSPIEAWGLRLPTHAEWQYACRSTPNRDSARAVPHFNPWPKYNDLPQAVHGSCIDQWEGKLGRPAKAFTGSQVQVVSLFEKYDKGENPAPAEILGQFLATAWWADPASRGYTAGSMTGPPRSPDLMLPNAWGLRGMSDNACEWVLCLETPGDVRAFSTAILNGDDNSPILAKAVVFLAGGSTREYFEAKLDWKTYAIWGGRPMREDGEGIDPQTWAEANGESALAMEYASGCRFVADRVLNSEWVVRVRTDSLVADDSQTIEQYFRNCRLTMEEIMSENEKLEALRILATYEAIARYHANDKGRAAAALEGNMRSNQPVDKKPKLSASDIFGGPSQPDRAEPSAKAAMNDDELFTQALRMVVMAETAKE